MNDINDRGLKDFLQPIWAGKWIILISMIVALAVGLTVSVISSNVYQCQALIAVPESSKLTAITSESYGTMFVMVNVGGTTPYKSRPTTVTIINVAETKAVISQLQQRLINGETPPPFVVGDDKKIKDIRLEPIKGSENYFRLIILTIKDQKTAETISHKVLDYLASNQYVHEKIAEEITSAEQGIRDTEDALVKAIKQRDGLSRSKQFQQNPNFNPAEMEASINGLKIRLATLRNNRSSINSYRYIEPPSGPQDAVKPDVVANLLMSMASGLFLGLLVVFLKQGISDRYIK